MAKYWVQGFLLGLAYVAPIGMQNLYVINVAAGGNARKTALVTAATIFFDVTLAVSCFFGVGLVIESFPAVRRVILLAGSAVVTFVGVTLIRFAPRLRSADARANDLAPARVVASCFAVTWLNPQAVIDGSLLLGGYRASLPAGASAGFILGVCLASATWFSLLSLVVGLFGARVNQRTARLINVVCGIALMAYGLKLGLALVR